MKKTMKKLAGDLKAVLDRDGIKLTDAMAFVGIVLFVFLIFLTGVIIPHYKMKSIENERIAAEYALAEKWRTHLRYEAALKKASKMRVVFTGVNNEVYKAIGGVEPGRGVISGKRNVNVDGFDITIGIDENGRNFLESEKPGGRPGEKTRQYTDFY